jgi:YVTN family beta-propeller protein
MSRDDVTRPRALLNSAVLNRAVLNGFWKFTVALSLFLSCFAFSIFCMTAHASAPAFASPQAARDGQSKESKRRIVREGISIEFDIEIAGASQKEAKDLREGDDATIRFTITDTSTGKPLTNLYPVGWMDIRRDDVGVDCAKKVAGFLGQSLTGRPEFDLNSYYVLALNQDATITVVDPMFEFGGTKLLALVALKSSGHDWALTSDQSRLFVSMPDANQVAVVDTATWKIINNLDAGSNPTRLALQPDEHYIWAAYNDSAGVKAVSGVAPIRTTDLNVKAKIPTGRGAHEIAFSSDNNFAFVTNRDDDTVSVIDIRTLEKIKDIKTGQRPASIAFSKTARAAYVASEGDGRITVIDGQSLKTIASLQADPGLGQIKFAPGDRFAFVVNTEKNVVNIIDASSNRIIQAVDVKEGPDQIAFSNTLCYVRHKRSEYVLMIPLDQVGREGKSVPVVDFPGGQAPFGKTRYPSPADGIIQAPGESAVLVANAADKTIYYYKEGMAAPMGNFSNYNREARAVMVVNRSIKERSAGVYTTTIKLRRAGLYDLAFLLDSPRVVHCFEVAVASNPEMAGQNNTVPLIIEPVIKDRILLVDEPARLQFKLIDARTRKLRNGLTDLQALTFLAPGTWQKRQFARQTGDGIYEIEFVPPEPGVYYIYLGSASAGLKLNNPQFLILEARQKPGK